MNHITKGGDLDQDSFFEDFGADASKLDNDFSLVEMSGSFFKDGTFNDEAFLKENQQYKDALETIRQLKQRLIRRTEIIDEIRKYYLRDIVTVKHIMRDLLINTEREAIYRQYEHVLPSLDLKRALILHAPIKTELQIKFCNECGGHLEIISRDSDEVEMLKKVISEARERENRWRVKLATMDSEIETTGRGRAETVKAHMEEKKFLYAEMKKLKEEAEQHKLHMTTMLKNSKRVKEENETFKSNNANLFEAAHKLEVTEKELDLIKINFQETNDKLAFFQTSEKNIQKNFAETKLVLHEAKASVEKLTQEIHYVKQENVSHALVQQKLQESYKVVEKALQSSEARTEEKRVEIAALNDKAVEVEQQHQQVVLALDKNIDSLRFEIKDFAKTQRRHKKEVAAITEKVKKANTIISKLKSIKRDHEMDLLDNAEEIQLYEEEITAMQQFIRDKISQKSFTDHLEGVDMPDVLQKMQALLQGGEQDEAAALQAKLKAESALEKGGSMSTFRSDEAVGKTLNAEKAEEEVEEGSSPSLGKGKRTRRSAGIRLKNQKEIAAVPGNKNEVQNLAKFTKAPRGNAVMAEKRRRRRRQGEGIAEEDDDDMEGLSDDEDEEDAPLTAEEQLEADIAEIQLDDDEQEGANGGGNDDDSLTSVNSSGTLGRRKSKGGNKKKGGNTPGKGKAAPSPLKKATKKAASSSSSSVKDESTSGTKRQKSMGREEMTKSMGNKVPPKSPGTGIRKTASRDAGDATPSRKVSKKKKSKLTTKSKPSTISNSASSSAGDVLALDDDSLLGDEEDDDDELNDPLDADFMDSDDENNENEGIDPEDLENELLLSQSVSRRGSSSLSRKASRKAIKPTASAPTSATKANKALKTSRKSSARARNDSEEPGDDLMDDQLGSDGDADNPEESRPASKDKEGIAATGTGEEGEDEESPGEEEIEIRVRSRKKVQQSTPKQRPPKTVEAVATPTKKGKKVKKFKIVKRQMSEAAGPLSRSVTPVEVEEEEEDEEDEYEEVEEEVEPPKMLTSTASLRNKPPLIRCRSIPRNMKLKIAHRIIQYAKEHKEDFAWPHLPDKKTDPAGYMRRVSMDIDNAVNVYDRDTLTTTNYHVVPVIPIEVKRFVTAFTPKNKPTMYLPAPVATEKIVDLDPPHPEASLFELQLRESLLNSIASYPNVSENQAHTYMNGTSDVVHTYCKMFDKSLESTWESLLINRKAMDYFLKMLIVLEGMISLTSENASNEDLAEICARIVPLAGSTLSSNITTQWQEECKISDDIILDLLPVVNYDTGERELKKFDRFFESESQEKTSGKVALCLDTISKMSQYTTDSTLKLNSYLVDVLKDWSKAKGVFFDLDARIESEREKLRKQLEVRMNALARDVTKINKLYENALDKITKLETKVKELVRVEAELAICTTKLEEAEYNADVKTAQMEELRIATSTAQAQLARSNSIIFAHEGELTQLNVLLSKTQTSLEVSQQKAAILDADLTKMTTEKLHFETQYNQLVEKEESRKKNQVTQSTQADPAVASIAIQTEFLVPPMELRTVVANKLTSAGVKKYPQVMSQSLDHMPHNFIDENREQLHSLVPGARKHSVVNPNLLHPVEHTTGHLAHNVYSHGPLASNVNYGTSGAPKVFDVSSHFHRPTTQPVATSLHPHSQPIASGRVEQQAHTHPTVANPSIYGVGDVHPDHEYLHNGGKAGGPHRALTPQEAFQSTRAGSSNSINNDFNTHFDFKMSPPAISYDQYHNNNNYYSEEEMLAMTNNIRLNSTPGNRNSSAERIHRQQSADRAQRAQQHGGSAGGGRDAFHGSSDSSVGSDSFNMFPHGISHGPVVNQYNNPNKHLNSSSSVGSSNSSTSNAHSTTVRIPPIDIHYQESGGGEKQAMHFPEKFVLVKQHSNEKVSNNPITGFPAHIELEFSLPTIRNSFSHTTPSLSSGYNSLHPLMKLSSEFNDSEQDFNLSPTDKSVDHSIRSFERSANVTQDGFGKKGVAFSNNVDNRNSEVVNGIVYNYRAGSVMAGLDKFISPYKTESNKIFDNTTASHKKTRDRDRHPSTETFTLGIDVPSQNRQQQGQQTQRMVDALEQVSVDKKKKRGGAVVIPTGIPAPVAPPPVFKGPLAYGGLGVLGGSSSMKSSRSAAAIPSPAAQLDVSEGQGGVSARTIKDMQRQLLSR